MKSMWKIASVLVAVGLLAVSANAATTTNDQRVGSTANLSGVVAAGLATPVNMKGTADFTDTAAVGTAGSYEIFQVISIPSNSVVLGVSAEVATGEDSAMTFVVGDSVASNTYINIAVDGAATNTVYQKYGCTNWYPSGGWIGVWPCTAADAAKIKVRATVVPLK